jgi:hypothetical protein
MFFRQFCGKETQLRTREDAEKRKGGQLALSALNKKCAKAAQELFEFFRHHRELQLSLRQ